LSGFGSDEGLGTVCSPATPHQRAADTATIRALPAGPFDAASHSTLSRLAARPTDFE